MKNRHYQFTNLYNVRDLGGYHTTDGFCTKEKKYIRASAAGTLEQDEIDQLFEDGVRVIIDFRNATEIANKPHPIGEDSRFVYYNIDLLGSFDNMRMRNYQSLTDLYIDLFDFSKEKIAHIFTVFHDHLADGIFFNCTAGKDRTGIVSFLLLKLAGVPDQEILDNYAESSLNNAKIFFGGNSLKDQMYHSSDPENLSRAINYFYERYFGVENYLALIGLKHDEIAALRDNFRQCCGCHQ